MDNHKGYRNEIQVVGVTLMVVEYVTGDRNA